MTRRPIRRSWTFLLLGLIVGCPAVAPDGAAAHTCALLDDGSVWCWGFNAHGELGDGTIWDRARPVGVAGLPAARSVAAGVGYTCATAVDGRVLCWGQNDLGQLGDGTTADRPTPAPVTGLAGVRTAAAGPSAACAVLETGEVLCWGTLGDAAGSPMAVTGLPAAAVDVSVGDFSACAILTAGEVWCWGTTGQAYAWSSQAISIVVGWNDCAVLADGSVTCSPDPLPAPAVTVSGSRGQQCAVLSDGTVWCWGYAPFGFSSNNSHVHPVAYATGATAVAVGDGFACARLASGEVSCWGDNWAGQLGDGTNRTRTSPVPVVGLPRPATGVTASLGRYVFRSGCGGSTTP